MKSLLALFFAGLSIFTAWLFWVPFLQFLWSLIPPAAAYAWAGKLVCLVLVGWMGGIGLPLILLVIAAMIAVA